MSVTVITGAGGGMGLACLQTVDEDPLLLVDVNEEALAVASSLAPDAETALIDLGDVEALGSLGNRIEARGGLRHLIHLAGVSPTMDDVDRVLQVDLVGSVALVDMVTDMSQPGSVAVCTASIAGHLFPTSPQLDAILDEPGSPDLRSRLEEAMGSTLNPGIAYALAKRGIIRLCQGRAAAWGARGARIVSVSPGLIDTPMGRLELRDNPGKQGLLGRTPARAPEDDGSPDLPGRTADIADAVRFLVSPMARFITGCDIRVDGGLVAALTTEASA